MRQQPSLTKLNCIFGHKSTSFKTHQVISYSLLAFIQAPGVPLFLSSEKTQANQNTLSFKTRQRTCILRFFVDYRNKDFKNIEITLFLDFTVLAVESITLIL